jgi:hypothetical protein
VITADALHTQRAHAEYLRAVGAGFVFTCKQNQPGLYLPSTRSRGRRPRSPSRDVDTGHGRISTRTIQVLPAPADLPFPHVKQVWLVERYVTDPAGTPPDLHAVDVGATAALWRFLLGVDVVESAQARLRPLDEPLEEFRSCAAVPPPPAAPSATDVDCDVTAGGRAERHRRRASGILLAAFWNRRLPSSFTKRGLCVVGVRGVPHNSLSRTATAPKALVHVHAESGRRALLLCGPTAGNTPKGSRRVGSSGNSGPCC